MTGKVMTASERPERRTGPVPPPAAACPACGETSHVPFITNADTYGVVTCSACGLGRTQPQPPDHQLRTLYEGDYTDVSGRKFGGPLETVRRVVARALAARIVRRAGTHGRVLDVGCGDGKVLVALAARRLSCTGTEINPRVRETLPPGADIALHTGALEDAHFASRSFDIIILRHVLEHVRDPAATLREVRRLLAPGGSLIVAVPNLASWQARLSRDRWFHLDLPRHLYHFTPPALTLLLERSGFAVARVSHFSFEQNPYGWLQSGFNMAGGRWRALYDQLRSAGAAHARKPDPVALGAAVLLFPFCMVLAYVESAARAGGTIEVWSRPLE